MNRTDILKRKIVSIVNEEIKYVEGRAIYAANFIKAQYTPDELENPDKLINIQDIQTDLYNSVYKPWLEHLESLRKEIKNYKD